MSMLAWGGYEVTTSHALLLPTSSTTFNISYRDTVDGDTKSLSQTADSLSLEMPSTSGGQAIINGSLRLALSGKTYVDNNGKLITDINSTTGTGTDSGTINYQTGMAVLTNWAIGTNTVTVQSMATADDPPAITQIIFRTPVAPIKTGSMQIFAELEDGTKLTLSVGDQGQILGNKYAHGFADLKNGVIALQFYEQLKVSDYPNISSEPWYDANNIYQLSKSDNTNYINKPVYAKPNSIRYNAVAYTYLPLDSSIIGLDPVRLPSDGRVQFVRRGDLVAITEQKSLGIASAQVGTTVNLGFERLSDVVVVDSNGVKVDITQMDIDLDAGTITFNNTYQASSYTLPLTAKYRLMDMGMVLEVDISGRVSLSTTITHDYTVNAVFSSLLVAGDMQARVTNVFSQASWGDQVFRDELSGNRASSQLQVANNPIIVTNRSAIDERWALVFTSTTQFRVIGEITGEIATSSITGDTQPLNPMTGQPYFIIPAAAWGTGWSAGNVVRFNTVSAKYPVWIGNAIQQHQGTSKDTYDFTIGYHANVDRERV